MKKIIAIIALTGICAFMPPSTRIEFEAPDSYPEGVVYFPKEDAYFVSSARTGTIGKVTPQGKYSVFYQDATLKSSYGMKVHPDGKRLFACIGDANYSKLQTQETHKKMIRLISVDLRSGKKLSDVDLSGLVPGNHFGNDLTFDKQGNAYVTDSFANVIYKVDKDGKASVFAKSDLWKTEGVGLNGIAWNPANFLIVANGGTGSLYKVDIANPANVQKVKSNQFFMNADGILFADGNTLTLVQNGGSNKIYQIQSTDNWQSAKVKSATSVEDFFAFPSTATVNKNEIWVMNAKFNELNDSTSVVSKKFSIQKANFRPVN